MDLESRKNVFLRKLICYYILSAAFTYAARDEPVLTSRVLPYDTSANLQRQMYTSTALYTSRFRTTMKTPDNPLDATSRRNLLPKHSFVLLMAFEAAVNLERWNELQGIIEV